MLDAGAVILLALAVYIAFSAPSLGAPGILVMLFLFARLTPRLASIQSAYQRLTLAMPPFMRVMQAIDEWEAAAEGDTRDDKPPQLRRALVIDRVSYRHAVTRSSGREGTAYPGAMMAEQHSSVPCRQWRKTQRQAPSGEARTVVAEYLELV